ncbi:MAG: L,D-transpeptidase family protein [Eggerthellaceae bacterium]
MATQQTDVSDEPAAAATATQSELQAGTQDDTGASSESAATAAASAASSGSESSSARSDEADSATSTQDAASDDQKTSSSQAEAPKKDTTASTDSNSASTKADGWHAANSGMTYWKNGEQVKGAWIVTKDAPYSGVSGSKRYWIDADGTLAKGRIVDPSDKRDAGAGYYAYATAKGYAATGKTNYKGLVLTPDSKGRLTTARGFKTTAAYDGVKRTYYYVSIPGHSGASAAKTGYFKANGSAYFGYASKGYVCTTRCTVKGGVVLAAKNGKLAGKKGFVTSSAYNGGTKHRYYFSSISGHSGYLKAKTGFFTVKGKRYYAQGNGALVCNGYYRIKGKWYCASASGKLSGPLSGVGSMVKKAQAQRSSTNYLVMVSTSKFHMGVFKRSGGSWKLKHYWVCSVGKKATPTPHGTFRTYTRGYSFGNGFTCYWYTAFYGGYMMHSQTYYQNTFRIKGGSLGKRASHGCVRIDISHAKWVYYHIPLGTTVVTY